MPALRTIQRVSGPTLTISVPADFAGQEVEVLIQSLEPTRPGTEPGLAPFIMAKPPLTEEDIQLFRQNPYPLRGTGGAFIEPFAPAVPADDWEACLGDLRVKPDDPA